LTPCAAGSVNTIHGMPNRSTSMPKPLDQNVGPNGITMVPFSDSPLNTRSASAGVPAEKVTVKPYEVVERGGVESTGAGKQPQSTRNSWFVAVVVQPSDWIAAVCGVSPPVTDTRRKSVPRALRSLRLLSNGIQSAGS
jgi:hypothetical protein